MQIFTLATVLPVVAHALSGTALYGAALSIGAVAMFVTMPLVPAAIARFGLPRVLTAGTALYVAGTAVAATAPTMVVFVAGRGIGGLGSGFLASLGLSAVASQFPAERRAGVISLLSAAWIVPGIAGPPYAALVTALLGWRVALVLLVPGLLAARLIVARRLTFAPATRRVPVPLPATIAFVVAIGTTLAGQQLAPPFGFAIVVAAALATLVVAARFAPPGTLRVRRGSAAAVGGMFVVTFAYFGADGIVTLAALDGMGRPLVAGGAILTASTLAWSFASLAQPWLLQRLHVPARRLAALGGYGLAVGLAGAAVALARDPHSTGAFVAFASAWVVAGAGMGVAYPAFSATAVDVRPEAALVAANATVLAELLGAMLSQSVAGAFVGGRALPGALGPHLTTAYVVYACAALAIPAFASRTQARRAFARPA